MAFVKQIALTLVFLLGAAALWTHFSVVPGRYLLNADLGLPPSVMKGIAALSPADDAPKIAGTPGRDRRGDGVPLVAVDAVVSSVTRDRLRAIGTGEAQRSVAIYPDATGIISAVDFVSGDEVSQGKVLAVLQNDTERLAVDRTRIALSAAQEQLRRYQALSSSSSITSVQVDEVRRVAESAALDVEGAEVALQRRNIIAPIAGRVGLVAIDVGALVGSQTLIATVDDRSRLKIVFNTPEAFVPNLRIGQPIEAVPTTRSGHAFTGEISALDSRLDEASRTLRTEAMIDNVGDQLRPGMSFTVEIAFEGQSYLSVDPLAIQWERAGPFVWVVADKKAGKSPIRIIERNVDRVLVASDTLRDGQMVVTEGVQQLRDGIEVRIQVPAELPETPATPEAEMPPMAGIDAADGRSEGRASDRPVLPASSQAVAARAGAQAEAAQ